jgi:hypothetical protein
MFFEHSPVKRIAVHRKCAHSLAHILDVISSIKLSETGTAGYSLTKPAAPFQNYSGAFNYRLMRGGSRLSMHSYGCAIDLDAEHNGFGQQPKPPGFTRIHPVVRAFEQAGWVWGGHWSKPDPMHFQAARV